MVLDGLRNRRSSKTKRTGTTAADLLKTLKVPRSSDSMNGNVSMVPENNGNVLMTPESNGNIVITSSNLVVTSSSFDENGPIQQQLAAAVQHAALSNTSSNSQPPTRTRGRRRSSIVSLSTYTGGNLAAIPEDKPISTPDNDANSYNANERRHTFSDQKINKQINITSQVKEQVRRQARALSCPILLTDEVNAAAIERLEGIRSATIGEGISWHNEAVSADKLDPPSYWVGCSFRYYPVSNKVDIIVRQTGVLPETRKPNISKLTLRVSLQPLKGKSHTVTLRRSANDNTFRSHNFQFEGINASYLEDMVIKMKLTAHFGLFSKKKSARWFISMEKCGIMTYHTEWKKCTTLGEY